MEGKQLGYGRKGKKERKVYLTEYNKQFYKKCSLFKQKLNVRPVRTEDDLKQLF